MPPNRSRIRRGKPGSWGGLRESFARPETAHASESRCWLRKSRFLDLVFRFASESEPSARNDNVDRVMAAELRSARTLRLPSGQAYSTPVPAEKSGWFTTGETPVVHYLHLYFCGERLMATALRLPIRVRCGKNGVTSNGILSRAESRVTGAAFTSSTWSSQGFTFRRPPSGKAAI
jgi:hypothetical protein